MATQMLPKIVDTREYLVAYLTRQSSFRTSLITSRIVEMTIQMIAARKILATIGARERFTVTVRFRVQIEDYLIWTCCIATAARKLGTSRMHGKQVTFEIYVWFEGLRAEIAPDMTALWEIKNKNVFNFVRLNKVQWWLQLRVTIYNMKTSERKSLMNGFLYYCDYTIPLRKIAYFWWRTCAVSFFSRQQ